MKHTVHVNRHRIAKNKKTGENEPPLTVTNYRGNQYGHEVIIKGPCRLVYRPCNPLGCGATAFIEIESGVEVEVVETSSEGKSCRTK